MIPTECRSSPRYASPAAPWLRALFPPQERRRPNATWQHAIRALVGRLNPTRRKRSNPRVIKRKVLKWPAKRLHHAHWPQPTHTPEITIQMLI
ncbi:hypothetical protein E3T32_03935 [Cryobacterium sp. TMT2-23]|nr:hypothetical protein E3T32_03935 [Cryobacterium sp. TMT2-23]